ncbi:glycosyltransferase family 8 protein [Ruminobacter sp.]|uniref:glycosyltransferase family 8 protein n=1 Tax=Ruminobacter sp. TaxID=2774296 RepID=UPI0038634EF4
MNNNIVVCSDSNYAKYFVPLFESIVQNTTYSVNFYVIYSTINESDIRDITAIVRQNPDNTVNFIKFDFLDELAKMEYNEDVPTFRGGYDAYTRLFLPSILKPYGVKKCLYMDVDIIVNKNLDELLNITDNIECMGGVVDTVSIEMKIPLSKADYVNSGVLALNLEMLESLNFSRECLAFAKANKDSIVLFDQDIISNVFPDSDKRMKLLDFKFNTYHSKTSYVKNAVVLHFTGPFKPWNPKCRWRLKKCIWVKYNLAARLVLRGWNMNCRRVELLGKVVSSVRFWCNCWLKLRLMLKILK